MGTSGQSFGAFAVKGVLLELEGDSQERKDVSHGGWGCWGTLPPGTSIPLEVQPPFFIGWFPNRHYFSRGLSSSKRDHHFQNGGWLPGILLMVQESGKLTSWGWGCRTPMIFTMFGFFTSQVVVFSPDFERTINSIPFLSAVLSRWFSFKVGHVIVPWRVSIGGWGRISLLETNITKPLKNGRETIIRLPLIWGV